MAKAYTKEFIISVYLHRFVSLPLDTVANLEHLANKLYDEVGKDKFRTYASVTPEAIREYQCSM